MKAFGISDSLATTIFIIQLEILLLKGYTYLFIEADHLFITKDLMDVD